MVMNWGIILIIISPTITFPNLNKNLNSKGSKFGVLGRGGGGGGGKYFFFVEGVIKAFCYNPIQFRLT